MTTAFRSQHHCKDAGE